MEEGNEKILPGPRPPVRGADPDSYWCVMGKKKKSSARPARPDAAAGASGAPSGPPPSPPAPGAPGPAAGAPLPQGDPTRRPFTPEVMDKTVIAVPLLTELRREAAARAADPSRPPRLYDVILDVNLMYREGRQQARARVQELVDDILAAFGIPAGEQGINAHKSRLSQQYLFGRLEARVIEELVRRDSGPRATGSYSPDAGAPPPQQAIYHIWPDFPVKAQTTRSVSTVKADAAHNSFAALGAGLVWAVIDSGIDGGHPHFRKHRNVELDSPLWHADFTALGGAGAPLVDRFGHGTHVAGILAGEMQADAGHRIVAEVRRRDERGEVRPEKVTLRRICGMAPQCKLVSLKVLDDQGQGLTSNIIAALEHVQEINGNGRRLRVHGVNLSVGYDFEPEWFACGQSPLCVEVDRLVRSGVVVVVAAGNTGYGLADSAARGPVAAGMPLSINDPGNAELAITVGSTHRDMPHVYGVSYFSSKGPTGDGRPKPDLVAPGEKIISCQSGSLGGRPAPAPAGAAPPQAPPDPPLTPAAAPPAAPPPPAPAAAVPGVAAPAADVVVGLYREESGTSMAAPHVSGVIAAFLSIRREFIGQAEAVKKIFLATATDLNREKSFQGRGLVDLMRAIQSV
jgi:serine protease AprX